jgi:hypothetical protein
MKIFQTSCKSVISEGYNAYVARVMSTVDGKWLDRDLDLDCWDNIRQPVLFGTAIHQIVKEKNTMMETSSISKWPHIPSSTFTSSSEAAIRSISCADPTQLLYFMATMNIVSF